ncbi:TlpA family protein disulfide reductase [Undibacterium pigrum]|uniref:Thiol-disulfide isomerase/thioredoxin n=1 Tax=Undibacterium pigrum TaxID=401470 RepID=A0A318JAA6_9BURK|nr:TlpA disulfide reductase family protein [Undibacterium pigrum]PXX44927.1 thiol-disulfide isomerase/thioredoxin [Undibacterium pigrum]
MVFLNLKLKSLATALIVLAGWNMPALALETGKPAPEFSAQSSKGNIQLADYRGKVVYLDFWASWCGPCKQSFPWMNAMQSKYGAQGFQVVAINLDSKPEEAQEFLKSTPGNFHIAYDPKGVMPRQYEIKGMPSSILIDRDGKVLYQHAGFTEASKTKIEQAIQAGLGNK